MIKSNHILTVIIIVALSVIIYLQWTKIGALRIENNEYDLKIEQLEKKRLEAVKQSEAHKLTLDSLQSANDSLKMIYNEIPKDKDVKPPIVINGNNSWGQITGVLKVDGDTLD